MLNFALSNEYQKSLTSLPQMVQKKTIKAIEKLCFAETLTAIQQDNGLHFEELKSFKNRKTRVYSVRIDQGYRLMPLLPVEVNEGQFIDDLDIEYESQRGYHSERKGDVSEVCGFSLIDEDAS
jgi:plasmid maintenance system killer protein